MKKLSKKLLSVLTAAAMIFTVLATPIGEILGFTGEAVKASAAAEILTSTYYTLCNVLSNKMLNVYGSNSSSGTNVTIYSNDGTSGQHFKFINSGSNYVIEPECAPSCALNVYGETASNGSNVNIWTKTGNTTQSWIMEYNTSYSAYVIRSAANTNLVLTATETSNSSNVSLSTYVANSSSQLWKLNVSSSSANDSSVCEITTAQIQKVLDDHNYKTGKYWTPLKSGDSTTSGYMGSDRKSSTSYSYNGVQCYGFANYILHKVTGLSVNPNNGTNENWQYIKASDVTELKVGDIVRIGKNNSDGHTGVVLTVKGTTCTFAECWGGSSYGNKINIGGKLSSSSYGSHSTLASMKSNGSLLYVYRYKGSHKYSTSYTVDKAATCSAEGSKSRHCTTSGCTAKTDVTVIPKTSHSYTSSITTQPTCTTTGVRTYKCSVCGDSYTETIAKTSHTYSSSYTIDKAATCTAEGSKSRHCTTSGCTAKTDVTAIPMTSHNYASTVVAPTYNEQGYTLHKCVNCGDSYKDTYTDIKKLPAVKGFTSPSQSTSAIRLNWTKNANADGYVIEQFDGTSWIQIADITDSATITYKVTGLKSGTAYKFRMKAYVNGTDGVVYGTKTATLTVNTMASSVSGLALKSRSASALRLKWTKNTAVDGYIIEQKIDGKWVQIADIDSYKTIEYKVTGLNASTKYSFRMKAYAITKYGDKTYSGYTSTLSKTTSPANVTSLKIGGRAGTALRLNWDKNTSADGYIIEQYKGGKWIQIADITDNATTTYRIDGLSPATQYKFRVKAYNMVGTTALYSNYTATLAAYTNPSAVSGLKIAGKAGTALRLGWTQNTTADGYIIEQYIDGKWTRIARIAGNETLSYRVENLTKATTYKFRVATYNIEDNVAYYGAYVTISGTTL